jgi:hypothetical protein
VKTLFKFVVVIVVLLLMVLGGAALYIDQLAKSGIEKGATYALGVDTTVDSVRLAVRNGNFDLSGLDVANPAGYSEPLFLHVGSVSLNLPPEQLMEEVIRVPRIAIDDIGLTLLKNGPKANYDQILESLGRFESGETTAEAEPAAAKQLIIDELVITNVAAKVTVGILGEAATVNVKVPEIRMSNLGSDSGGLSSAELTNVVTKAVLDAVVQSGGIPSDLVKDLSSQLGDLGKVNIKLPEGLGTAASGLLGSGKKSDVDGNIGGVIDGLIGGFGSKKDK